MYRGILFILLSVSQVVSAQDKAPAFILGHFEDDYKIQYSISEEVWKQHPSAKYHIINWVVDGQYLVAQNDSGNSTSPGKYTRIDWMPFTGMEPFKWGFCLSVYDADSDSLAAMVTIANRKEPMSGCNGFPFSRMKMIPLDSLRVEHSSY